MEKINYTITLEDCRDFVKYQSKIKRLRDKTIKSLAVFWLVGFVVLFLTQHYNFNIESILHFFVIWGSIFCVIVLSYKFDLFHQYSKKIYKPFKDIDDIELQAKDDSLYTKSKRGSSSINWESIVDIYDTGRLFLIFINDFFAILVPKRAFENEKKAMEFFNFANEKISNIL